MAVSANYWNSAWFMENTSWADPLLVQTKSFNRIITTTYIAICSFIHVNLSPPHKHSSCEGMTHSTFVLNSQSCGKKYLLWLDAGTLSEFFYCTLTSYIPVGGLSWVGGWSSQKEGTTSSPLLCYWQSLCFNHGTEMDGVHRTSLAFRRFSQQ